MISMLQRVNLEERPRTVTQRESSHLNSQVLRLRIYFITQHNSTNLIKQFISMNEYLTKERAAKTGEKIILIVVLVKCVCFFDLFSSLHNMNII